MDRPDSAKPNLSINMKKLLCLTTLGFLAFSSLSQGATLIGVRSMTFTNTRADWYYIEELEVRNSGGVDVASTVFGTSANASGAPAFGSSINGPIDDVVGAGCCGNGWHSDTNATPPQQFYTITFPSLQDITEVTFWNRQDGCCQERMDGIEITYYDDVMGTGTLLASQQVDGLGTTGPGGSSVAAVPEPSTGLLALLAFSGFFIRRRRS